ncbi:MULTISPECIES: hypothetical protein [Brevibacillus]|uniref:hypothetical protein n=1 Tax=Brevibacillus TaxID=55080 RepID=UPI00156AF65D|nr:MULTISPECIES: hypothetical protein [Brevibacillus]NRQ52049.1 hypothetical protein [Brevibacillus sp. HD1.4A]
MITVHADSPEDVVYRLAIPLANTGQQEVSRKLVEAALPKPTMRADRVSAAPSSEEALAEAEILVVDDDALNLKVLLKQLSLDQYRVTTARDGREAMQILGNRMKIRLIPLRR